MSVEESAFRRHLARQAADVYFLLIFLASFSSPHVVLRTTRFLGCQPSTLVHNHHVPQKRRLRRVLPFAAQNTFVHIGLFKLFVGHITFSLSIWRILAVRIIKKQWNCGMAREADRFQPQMVSSMRQRSQCHLPITRATHTAGLESP